MSDTKLAATLDPNVAAVLQIGELVGQTKAFTRVAGRCTAAKAQALAAVRHNKQYKILGLDWETFCREKVGMDRHLAEEHIRDLKEFGPQYFDVTQVTRIKPAKYRMIAPSVTPQGLLHEGQTIAFTEEEAPRLTAAITAITKATTNGRKPKPPAPAEPDGGPAAMAEHALVDALNSCTAVRRGTLSHSERVRFRCTMQDAIAALQHLHHVHR